MKRLLISLALVWIAAASTAAAQVRVVTTTTDSAAIAEVVGGSLVSVESLTRGTSDPHFAQAKPSMIRQAYDADLLVLIGADLEVGWLPAVLQSARNPGILPGQPGHLDLSTFVRRLDMPTGPVTRAMGHVHAKGNPHFWLDPRNGVVIARAIAARLGAIDPANAEAYAANANAFAATIDERMAEWRQALAPLAGRKVVTQHKSLVYLADAFGFSVLTEIEPMPGIEPSAAHLRSLVAEIGNDDVAGILVEPLYDLRPAQFLSNETGVPVAVVPQSVGALDGIDSYVGLFDRIIAEISKAGIV